MLLMRLYLLAGLILHKVVWVWMGRGMARASSPWPAVVLVARFVKTAMLIGIMIQTGVPDLLPILQDPGVLRLVGVPLYTLGLIIAVLGRVHLGTSWSDIEVAHLQLKHEVVSHGIYRFIRHPIYTGDVALLIGFELSLNSWLVLLVGGVIVVVIRQALLEERALLQRLPGYEKYCRTTKRFIPFLV